MEVITHGTIRRLRTAALYTLGAGFLASSAGAQDFGLGDWDHERAYDGWSAENFLETAEVYGEDGEAIGTVENLLINDDGQIVALIAQVGGVWDIADTHVAVPWDEASFDDAGNPVIPVDEDTADDYSIFKEEYFTKADVGSIDTVEDDVETGLDIWKATDLINDYAVLQTGAGVGYVNDLIFDNDGKLQSVIVNATEYLEPGYYAYPWYAEGYDGYAWDPGLGRYVLPYDEAEIAAFDTAFDYDELEGL